MTQLACVRARVTRIQRLSEHVVRVSVAAAEILELPWGEHGPGPRADAYLKVLVPPPGARGIEVDVADISAWRRRFLARPEHERGWIRTYTIRDARRVQLDGQPAGELDLDVVLHAEPDGSMGPGARWGRDARVGTEIQLLVPGARAAWWAAWHPARAADAPVVLAVDETAVPAAAAIVDCIERGIPVNTDPAIPLAAPQRIQVAAEVPRSADACPAFGPAALSRPERASHGPGQSAAQPVDGTVHDAVHDAVAGTANEAVDETVDGTVATAITETRTLANGTELEWTWLPREGRTRNLAVELWLWQRLCARTRDPWRSRTGAGPNGATDGAALTADGEARDEDTEIVWHTAHEGGEGTYWFLAAESSGVKSLRRMCVSHGVAKEDISFMGYWRLGRATE